MIVWDSVTGQIINEKQFGSALNSAAISFDNSHIALALNEKTGYLVDS